MEDEKVVSSEEVEVEEKDEAADEAEESKSTEETAEEEAEKFVEGEVVPASKFNQLLRQKKKLERELQTKKAPEAEETEETEEKSENEFDKLLNEKLKPIQEELKRTKENEQKADRSKFFDAHPEYRDDSEKYQELLDELDVSINPNSPDSLYVQLEKAHRIISGGTVNDNVRQRTAEMASEASSGGASNDSVKDEFSAEDKKIQKQWGLTDEEMRAYKAKVESGSMTVHV